MRNSESFLCRRLKRRSLSFGAVLLAFFLCHSCLLATGAESTSEVYYSTTGGTVEKMTRQGDALGEAQILIADLESPFKLTLSPDGKILAVAAGDKEAPELVLLDLENQQTRRVPLGAAISDLAGMEAGTLVAASRGRFYLVDRGGSIEEWNARKGLNPPGRKGEFVCPVPGSSSALISFQKDDDNSDAKGNRLLVLGTRPLEPLHDLLLPRDHPELHRPEDPKEQGPGPEVVLIAPLSNTVVMTLDLYGALALADFDAVLEGHWKNLAYLSTDAEGVFGKSFPDRATLLTLEGKEFVLVSNASNDGGFALFDLQKRQPIRFFAAAAGSDPPVFFPELGLAATVISGKVKSFSEEEGSSKEFEPGADLLVFDLQGLPAGEPAQMRTIPMGAETIRIARFGPEHVLVFIKANEQAEALLIKLPEGEIVDRKPVSTTPVRAISGNF